MLPTDSLSLCYLFKIVIKFKSQVIRFWKNLVKLHNELEL